MIKTKALHIIELGFATVRLRNDGIVNTHIHIKEAITVEQAEILKEAYLKITNGIKTPHLFTANKYVVIESEVMDYMKNVCNKYGKADAFVISSLAQKITGNFYLKFFQPSIPTKLFSNKKDALRWLQQFVN